MFVYVGGVQYLCTVDLVERLSKGATREWVGESGLQPALYFFIRIVPAHLVESDIVRTFGV